MGELNQRLSVVILIGLCAFIFASRLHTYEEPLERDLTTYAVIAHEMLNGKNLYSDLWDHKPPAIHVTYAAAELIAGYGRDSILLLNVVAAIATLLACYSTGAAAGGGRLGGIVAAVLWAVVCGDIALEANQPNTEVFLNAFLTWALAIVVRTEKTNLGLWNATLVGVLLAVASLYKPVVVMQAAALGFAYCAWPPKGSCKKALGEIALVAAIGAVAWGLVFAYFTVQGRGTAFVEAVFTYNRWYSGNLWRNLSYVLGWPKAEPISMGALAIAIPMVALSGLGVVLSILFGDRRPWFLLGAVAVATQIAVVMPGWFFPHYYQLWLPLLAIGAGWGVALLNRTLPGSFSTLSYAVGGVACLTAILLEMPNYLASAEACSAKKYGQTFIKTDRLAHQIDNLLQPGAQFYEWGDDTGLYFTSRRQPPSGILFAYPTLAGPLAQKLTGRLITDLDKSRPDLVVISNHTLSLTVREHPALNWFEENYRPLAYTDAFALFARKDLQPKVAH